jgi:DNA invertase Pin-like site-specific DNA recombinase
MNETPREERIDASKPRPAIIYCRIASQTQAGGSGALEEQEERCRTYARERHYKVIDVVHDVGVSGTSCERPGIKTIIDRLRKEDGLTVLVDRPDRLGRDAKMIKDFKQLLARHAASIDYPVRQLVLSQRTSQLAEMIADSRSRSRGRD